MVEIYIHFTGSKRAKTDLSIKM